MRELILPAEVWSPLVSYRPPYVVDEHGIVQHELLAKLLRKKGFDMDRPMRCDAWGSGLIFRQAEADWGPSAASE